jgi:hypothetical protein
MFKTQIQKSQTAKLIDKLQPQVTGGGRISTESAALLMSETRGHSEDLALSETLDGLMTSIESACNALGIKANDAQKRAGAFAGVLAANPKAHLTRRIKEAVASEGMTLVGSAMPLDGTFERVGMEAYDERENRNAVMYAIAYNMGSTRLDEFNEAHWATLTISPDQVGFGITTNLQWVYDGYQRGLTGKAQDWKKQNLIRAVANADIMKKEGTKITPVVITGENEGIFVDPTIVAPKTIVVEGESLRTAPLAIGKKIDLIEASTTPALIKTGIMDQTDTIEPSVVLNTVYVKIGGDVLAIPTGNLPFSNFIAAPQGLNKNHNLNFETRSVLINRNTRQANGSALVSLKPIVDNNWIVRLNLGLNGVLNVEFGSATVYGNNISAYNIRNSTGDELDMTVGPQAAIANLLNAGSIVGWDPLAYRSNANRRQAGQIIDVGQTTQLYNVPLRAPISVKHPAHMDMSTDASDVNALVAATRIRLNNEGVTALLNVASTLMAYVDTRDASGEGPDVLGVGRHYVRSTFFGENIDMNAIVDSVKSSERIADMQAALINKVRDYVYKMYVYSEFKAAYDALSGGVAPVPTVVLGTDPMLARYLNITGELRTLGGEFDVRVVSTLDTRVTGKIFITFGIFNEERNTAPHPLNFGNLVWGPELSLTANLSRANGSYSRETMVAPRYLFVNNCPVMTVLTVSGIPDIFDKMPIEFKNI